VTMVHMALYGIWDYQNERFLQPFQLALGHANHILALPYDTRVRYSMQHRVLLCIISNY
jgi:hypothetical protein